MRSFCPHTDCDRSKGVAFVRKEDWDEHLSRVHGSLGGVVGRSRSKLQDGDEVGGQSERLQKPEMTESDVDKAILERASAKKGLKPTKRAGQGAGNAKESLLLIRFPS